jgi:hypothetical protein
MVFPIDLVRKTGNLRIGVDYMELNEVTRKDCFQVPRNDNKL